MLRRIAMTTGLIAACTMYASSASAQHGPPGDVPRDSGGGSHPYGGGHEHPRSIPEFDPAAVGAFGVIVAGGGLLLARRRKR